MATILHNASDLQVDNNCLFLPPADRYFDQIQLWLQAPLTREQVNILSWINRHPMPRRGQVRDRRKVMKFQPLFKHRLQLRQVRLDTLRALDEMVGNNPVMINYIELASDHGYSGKWTVNDRDDAFEFLCRCWIRKYHRQSQGVRFVHNDEDGSVTRYDGPRGASNMNNTYAEKFCRNTGEEHSLHLERRLFRKSSCERLGLLTIQDLIQFDHDRFWNDTLKHVYDVDAKMLGRYLRNKCNHTRHRRFQSYQYRQGSRFSLDARVGHMCMVSCGTVQELVDVLGFSRVKPALVPISVYVEQLNDG